MLSWMTTFVVSLLGGALTALLTILFAIGALTGVDAGDNTTTPGTGHYGD